MIVVHVSVLYREPKLLKGRGSCAGAGHLFRVSVLYREPKLLKAKRSNIKFGTNAAVSVLYREPKLLKGLNTRSGNHHQYGFSALP